MENIEKRFNMKAVVTNGDMDIKYCDVPMPQIEANEVLVKVNAVGICGSDVPRVLGHVCPVYPTILGHEFSGTIEKIGSDVKNVKVGQRVAGIPLVPCFKCENCKNGNYGQCKTFLFLGTKLPGGMAEYLKCSEKNVYPISDTVSDIEGAMFEPVTVALHAILSEGEVSSHSCAVVGCGTIGLMMLQCLNALGVKKIVAMDIDDEKLKIAKELGASETINTKTQPEKIDSVEVDRVYECVGIESSIQTAIKIAGVHSVVMLVGLPRKDVVLTPEIFDRISKRELKLKGSWMSYSGEYPGEEWKLTEEFFRDGKINTKVMIEKVIPLEEVPKLFEQWNNGAPLGKKVIIKNS